MVFEKIEQQQKGKEGTDVWMVGEQLKDICRREPGCAELVEKDLEALPIDTAAKKIKDWADKLHKKQGGSCVCVPPDVAEGIIREHYGLPAANTQQPDDPTANMQQAAGILDLDAFL